MRFTLTSLVVLVTLLQVKCQSLDSLENDSLYSKKHYNVFKKSLKKLVKTEFEEIAIGDSIWIPLSITKSGNDISYGVISNWSDYPELPTFSIVDSAHYNIDCLVFGTIKKKEKDRGLFSVHVLVDGNVCGYEELGGKYYSPIKNGNLFEHHLMSFWFFVHK